MWPASRHAQAGLTYTPTNEINADARIVRRMANASSYEEGRKISRVSHSCVTNFTVAGPPLDVSERSQRRHPPRSPRLRADTGGRDGGGARATRGPARMLARPNGASIRRHSVMAGRPGFRGRGKRLSVNSASLLNRGDQ